MKARKPENRFQTGFPQLKSSLQKADINIAYSKVQLVLVTAGNRVVDSHRCFETKSLYSAAGLIDCIEAIIFSWTFWCSALVQSVNRAYSSRASLLENSTTTANPFRNNIVFLHFHSASHSTSLSEALPTTAIDTVSEFTRQSATGN